MTGTVFAETPIYDALILEHWLRQYAEVPQRFILGAGQAIGDLHLDIGVDCTEWIDAVRAISVEIGAGAANAGEIVSPQVGVDEGADWLIYGGPVYVMGEDFTLGERYPSEAEAEEINAAMLAEVLADELADDEGLEGGLAEATPDARTRQFPGTRARQVGELTDEHRGSVWAFHGSMRPNEDGLHAYDEQTERWLRRQDHGWKWFREGAEPVSYPHSPGTFAEQLGIALPDTQIGDMNA